jgi:Icc-related predicted phosphoesterase
MLIRAISDTHGELPAIEPCDVLVIAGDICGHYSQSIGSTGDCLGQARWLDTTFRQWLDAIPAKHVIATWGNHDWVAERMPDAVPKDLRWTLLVDRGVTIDGVKFWGSPYSPWFHDWAFNSPKGDCAAGEPFLRAKWAAIPDDTGVLVVHAPPKGFGDNMPNGASVGSVSLLDRIKTLQPRLSIHGHIHSGRGTWQLGRTTIANVAVMDDKYRLVCPPMSFEL